MRCEVLVGDCVEVLRGMPPASVDAIVCDPPYGLEFMGKDWDRLALSDNESGPQSEMWHDNGGSNPYARRATPRFAGKVLGSKGVLGREMQEWHEAWAREALRVLKPGGHLLAFGGTRTYHRLACAVEDAGFEIRDEVLSIFEATDAGRQFLASLTPEQLAALDKLGGGPLAWMYGSGFPKSLDVSKAIDKAAGAEREVVGSKLGQPGYSLADGPSDGVAMSGNVDGSLRNAEAECAVTAPATSEAAAWDGWGTALKPAHEPIVMARKPLSGTVAGNVLAHGTGALNIDGCRIGFASAVDERESKGKNRHGDFGHEHGANRIYGDYSRDELRENYDPTGRWPANVVLSHGEGCVLVGEREVRADGHHPAARGASGFGSASDSGAGGLKGQAGLEERHADGERVQVWECVPGCPVRLLDEQTGAAMHSAGKARPAKREAQATGMWGFAGDGMRYGDTGGASRFFYTAKASRGERDAGLREGLPRARRRRKREQQDAADRWWPRASNRHPTVKPIDLMRWLVRLVTPAGGVVLDPFVGSGTTGCAAVLEGFGFVGVERERGYVPVAEARIRFWREHPTGLPVEQALEAEGKRRRVRESGQLGLGF